jgi:hypothetical protein
VGRFGRSILLLVRLLILKLAGARLTGLAELGVVIVFSWSVLSVTETELASTLSPISGALRR